MSREEKKQEILKYIARRKGQATWNKVIDYMNDDAPTELKSSKMTTRELIKELEQGHRIKIIKGRPGQSHRLSINTESEYKKIQVELARCEYILKHLEIPVPKTSDISPEDSVTWLIVVQLNHMQKLPEHDSQILRTKAMQLLYAIASKKFRAISEAQKRDALQRKIFADPVQNIRQTRKSELKN